MTTEEAIKKLENFANHIEPNEEFIMAIKALNAEKNAENIKHRVSEIAMMCDEKDEKQMDILVKLLSLINDINVESEEEE